MNATERLLTDAMLNDPYRNLADPDRTIETVVIGKERISTITRADGTQFRVIASVPINGRRGTARIIYPKEAA